MSRWLPHFALLLGNMAIGLSVMAPAGMLSPLAADLHVNIHEAGLLVTYGAVVLCISSPVGAWLTSNIDRRIFHAGVIALLAIGEAATALMPDYVSVLILRLVMMAVAAVYTPQAAATIALLVPEKERAGSIAFVFLGWSLAFAGGLPLVTFLTAQLGWRAAYVMLAILSLLFAVVLWFALPSALKGRALSLSSFATIARNRTIVLILLLTLFTTSGQFNVVVYLAPLLHALTGAGPTTSGAFFAMMGSLGLIGNITATSIVPRLGVQSTFAISLGVVTAGLVLWAIGAGQLWIMGAGIACLGLGFAASNSMQQVRLVSAAPDLAAGTIALNTSILYVGQSVGSGIGGLLFARHLYVAQGYAAAAFGLVGLILLAFTWQRAPR
ncbi:MAG TPA: MFS transporter [Pseudolabrys sp.]|nr:MFS transporter [Pseudolabrys sp.]